MIKLVIKTSRAPTALGYSGVSSLGSKALPLTLTAACAVHPISFWQCPLAADYWKSLCLYVLIKWVSRHIKSYIKHWGFIFNNNKRGRPAAVVHRNTALYEDGPMTVSNLQLEVSLHTLGAGSRLAESTACTKTFLGVPASLSLCLSLSIKKIQ